MIFLLTGAWKSVPPYWIESLNWKRNYYNVFLRMKRICYMGSGRCIGLQRNKKLP